MMRRAWILLFVGMTLIMSSACEPAQPGAPGADAPPTAAPTHPAHTSVEAALQALQYGDAQGLFDAHLVSQQSPWCAPDFTRLLERLRKERTPQGCEQARALTQSEDDALEDQDALLVQTMRFVCERPEATCQDYASAVFTSQLDALPLWRARPLSWSLDRLQGDAQQATAYVTLRYPGLDQPTRTTLRLRVDQGRWYIVGEPAAWLPF